MEATDSDLPRNAIPCCEFTDAEAKMWRDAALPRVLPARWKRIKQVVDGAAFDRSDGMRVLASVQKTDGRVWLHVSVSHRIRSVTYEMLKEAKDLFVGDRYAYQVFPTRAKFVNINPNVLHVFAVIDGKGEPLPDFTGGGNSI